MPPFSIILESEIKELAKLASQTPLGCFVEVGVYQGGSAWHLEQLAIKQNRLIFLYDTFIGIPYKDAIDNHRIGDFSNTSYEQIKKIFNYATVIQGVFPASAIPMPKVAFAHIDCDQYKSIKSSALYLSDMMVAGGIMFFDDYNCLAGAKQAIDEVFGQKIERYLGNKMFVRF